MDDLDWLIGHCFQLFAKREYDWTLSFDQDINLRLECLWRLIEGGRISVTSSDDGVMFGLPEPVDAAARANSLLGGAIVTNVELEEGTLDLTIHFGPDRKLEVIPESSGFEAWELGGSNQLIVAVGGGELTVFRDV